MKFFCCVRVCVCLVQGQGRYRNFYESLRLARQFSYEYQQVSKRKNNLQTTLKRTTPLQCVCMRVCVRVLSHIELVILCLHILYIYTCAKEDFFLVRFATNERVMKFLHQMYSYINYCMYQINFRTP